MRIHWWIPALGLVAWATTAKAQEGLAYKLQDGPAILYTFGGDVNDASVGFGYQARYRHDKRFSVEFSAFWQQDESLDIGGQAPGLPAGSTIDLDIWAFALTARAGYEPLTNTYAYAGAGLGVYRLDVSNERLGPTPGGGAGFLDADAGTDVGWHLAGGMEWNFHRHWQLFGEYRLVFQEAGLQVQFAPNQQTPSTSSESDFSYDHMVLRMGINYRF